MDPILYWNSVASEANRVAHTTPHDSERGSRGPVGSSRAFAIVHLAMHDAYFTIHPAPHGTYLASPPVAPAGAQADAAVAAAAHATLSALYPNQKADLDLAHHRAGLSGPGHASGHAHGLAVAGAVLHARRSDPGLDDDGYAASVGRPAHRPDPSNPAQGYHAPHYGARAACFAVTSRHTLDAPPHPGAAPYQRALAEVRGKGAAPEVLGSLPPSNTPRTPKETLVGLFWAYDGAKGLGTPPRFYNQIVRAVAAARGNTVAQNAQLFALVNAALGDAGILAWDEQVPARPVATRSGYPGARHLARPHRDRRHRAERRLRPVLATAGRAQDQRTRHRQLHPELPRLPVRPCDLRRRRLAGHSPVLRGVRQRTGHAHRRP